MSVIEQKSDIPAGFKQMISELFGDSECGRLLESLVDNESPVSIRLNPRKGVDSPLYSGLKPVPWCGNGFYLPERPLFTANPLLHAGAFYVQEAASMIHGYIVSRLGFKESVVAVDLCAAPGGKSGVTLDNIPTGSVLVANEFVGKRAQVLRENMAKQGAEGVIVTNSPVNRIGAVGEIFDLMIADVPCSGEGMMRKESIARSQWSDGLVKSCQILQREILADSLPALKPGGWLIYSTCTFNKAENEDNVKWLIEEFGMENVEINIPEDWQIKKALTTEVKALRFLPSHTKSEGLFVALLRKSDNGASILKGNNLRYKTKVKAKDNNKKNVVPDLKKVRGWINISDYKLFTDDKGNARALTEKVDIMLSKLLAADVKVLSAGVDVAFIKGRDYAPAHPLALSGILNRDAFPSVELSQDEALNYLRCETLHFAPDIPKGYVVVRFQGIPLGFVNNIGARANNMYPSEWKIRNI